ncbi:MAG: hypothetical protein IIX54_05950 [Clostridia bacterium]|nr:hypothetical protein [Clostridia bacterium]
MHDFEYVPNHEWEPIRDELFKIIHKLQDEVRDEFTFQYHFVGSSKRKMITRDRNSNTGFDFDVNIEVNDPDENYSAEEIRNILHKGLDRVTNPYGYSIFGYDYTEDSTRVLTIKVKDKTNSRILHSCDFCIIYECGDGRQQYIRYNKKQNSYSWEYQPKGYMELPAKIEWVKEQGLWQQVRDYYIYKKNINDNPNKHSRTIFAETIHEIWQKKQINKRTMEIP